MDGAVFRSHKKLDLVTLAVIDMMIFAWGELSLPKLTNHLSHRPSFTQTTSFTRTNQAPHTTQSVAAGPVLRAVLAAPATGLALPAAAAAVLPAAAAALLALFAGLHGEEGLLAQLLLKGVGVDLLVFRRGLQWTNK